MLPLPLRLLRVLDLTQGAGGAYATRVMGDLGAEVIHLDGIDASRPAPDLLCNKLSFGLDLTKAEARSLIHRLVAVSNFVVSDASARPVVDFEAAAQARPDVIYVTLTGTDTPLQGVAAVAGALAALFHHRGTGQGQRVEVSSDALEASLRSDIILAAAAGREIDPAAHELQVPQDSPPYEAVAAPAAGVIQVPALPFRFSLTPAHIRLPAPSPGQHNDYVLREIMGLDESEAAGLQAARVVIRA